MKKIYQNDELFFFGFEKVLKMQASVFDGKIPLFFYFTLSSE